MAQRIPENAKFVKDPDEYLDYEWDWTNFLGRVNDTILTGTFIVDDVGVFLGTTTQGQVKMVAWLSSGTVDQEYRVRNSITTVAGRRAQRTILVKILEK